MEAISFYPETENSQKNFYPTPPNLVEKMLAGIDWDFVSSVLEPSAGKGDIAKRVCEHFRYKQHHYGDKFKYSDYDVDCVEIDPNLRAILKDKGFRVVHDDFLTMETAKHYDLIIMNPPFDRGAEHLLKAIRMQENGGGIVCLLNAETLRNPSTYARKILARELERLEAETTYIERAFVESERRTYVDVAMVKCTIPVAEKDSTILDKLHRDFSKDEQEQEQQRTEVAKGNYIDAIVDKFNFEVHAGVQLIREYNTLRPYLMNSLNSQYKSPIMELVMHGHNGGDASINKYIKETRKKYWDALFQNPEFTKNLTSNLQTELHSNVEKLADYDFSVYNIMELRVEMSKKVIGGIKETIMNLFDDWTRKTHWDENSQNRHYFDGWKTNDAFAVNKKVIIPLYGVWGWSGKFEPTGYQSGRKIADIEKVFDFLSGEASGYFSDNSLKRAEKEGQTKKIPLKYFNVTFYKKGTMHIEFTDMDVLQKFNLFAARDKNWLPPVYGKKRYQDMTQEEKKVIDSFEGEDSYNHVLERREYFLSEVQPIGLPA